MVALGSKATDQVRRDEYNHHGRSGTEAGKWIKGMRYSLIKDPANQTAKQLANLAEVQKTNKRMYRPFLLLGELRHIYRLLSALARKFADVFVGHAARAVGWSSLWARRSRSWRVNFHSNGWAICS